ncbi:hypothetical protein RY831_31045 [Noviherbaspirillum sp. CPCC 100848]|uniref:WYL domain-containing protein n=1 Tax=Noviherbaspirillum album TaxID=3080276 RepID=A0ABU6JIS0_9BURK|nr:hypothetical protein [Noviherbaspirillum sp. CPCC 100848]MEC4723579.1 hypothetical protein [Noviherbaspirillum sp. CPCC 100848]
MSSIIEQAIAQKLKLKLYYAACSRIVEPYAFGLDTEGQPVPLCFQNEAQKNVHRMGNWCAVRPKELASIKMLEESFTRIQSGYIRNHPAFHTVLIQV